jgi:hypothetical protein
MSSCMTSVSLLPARYPGPFPAVYRQLVGTTRHKLLGECISWKETCHGLDTTVLGEHYETIAMLGRESSSFGEKDEIQWFVRHRD